MKKEKIQIGKSLKIDKFLVSELKTSNMVKGGHSVASKDIKCTDDAACDATDGPSCNCQA